MLSSSESDDDLYSGYNDFDADLDDAGLEEDAEFQKAVRTSYGNRPGLRTGYKAGGRGLPSSMGRVGTASRLATGRMATGRLMTGVAPQANAGEKRPMTAVKAAGFQSSRNFDPMNQGGAAAAPPLEEKSQDSPEKIIKDMTKKVHILMEESALLVQQGKTQDALEKAKKAVANERQLCKKREELLSAEAASAEMNSDLTFGVLMHLAYTYQQCAMHSEAVNTYLLIVKSKDFKNPGRVRMNIGNIYFNQKKYVQAIKMYRMALDQIPTVNQKLRNRVLRNIGNAFLRLGQYSDAITSFEILLDAATFQDATGMERKLPSKDFRAGLNLVLCQFAVGDREKMCRSLQRMLQLHLHSPFDDERYINLQEDPKVAIFLDAIKDDGLHRFEIEERKLAEKYITLAAKLIAPAIRPTFAEGYDWCVETIKASPYASIAPELEITKALAYLKMKDFAHAVDTLKSFEKKEATMVSTAATNLSFLYFLEGKYGQADKYADIAMNADRYNPYALVNKGNCVYVNGDYEKALGFYDEALAVESTCTEALYNSGIVHKKMGDLEGAIDFFEKLHAMLPSNASVVHQLMTLSEDINDLAQAIEWGSLLVTLVPTDPNALAHLGELHDRDGDKSQAFQYHYEAFRYFPSDINILSWLGLYYSDSAAPMKAIPYFEKAAQVQPTEPKWRFAVAKCLRREGEYQEAYRIYKRMHVDFPDNITCLEQLEILASDMNLPEAQEYSEKLAKARKAEKLKLKRENSASSRTGSARRSSARSRSQRGGSSGRRLSERDESDVDMQSTNGSRAGSSTGTRPGISPSSTTKSIDASYSDPIGKLPERPKTAARRIDDDEDWGDDGEELLPD